uniref:Putative secreted protein n=1 Tax=Ixodes scapularis TaxID=6945 RepID=A0A4D5S2I1_IXOSC
MALYIIAGASFLVSCGCLSYCARTRSCRARRRRLFVRASGIYEWMEAVVASAGRQLDTHTPCRSDTSRCVGNACSMFAGGREHCALSLSLIVTRRDPLLPRNTKPVSEECFVCDLPCGGENLSACECVTYCASVFHTRNICTPGLRLITSEYGVRSW